MKRKNGSGGGRDFDLRSVHVTTPLPPANWSPETHAGARQVLYIACFIRGRDAMQKTHSTNVANNTSVSCCYLHEGNDLDEHGSHVAALPRAKSPRPVVRRTSGSSARRRGQSDKRVTTSTIHRVRNAFVDP